MTVTFVRRFILLTICLAVVFLATAEAREDTTLLMLTKLNFERLAEEQPVLCIRLLRQVARLMSLRLRQTTGILLDYLSDDANSS